MMTSMQRHNARIALAKKIVLDIAERFIYDTWSFNTPVVLRERIIYALKPFFMSNDIVDVKVHVLRDKDSFYPKISIEIVPMMSVDFTICITDEISDEEVV